METKPKKLLDQVRDVLRLKNYAYSTEKTYVDWIERFIRFPKLRHPKELNASEIEAFLTHLAVNQNVAPSTQNQALSALLFLYRHVLHIELTGYIEAVWAERDKRLPVVLTKAEVQLVIGQMSGLHQMMAKLLYGSGAQRAPRLMECLRLRVKDVDFERHQITVRDTKGNEDRVTMLPQTVAPLLRKHLVMVKQLHEADLANGYGMVELPYALARKYSNADREWCWQYIFPSEKHSIDPRSKVVRRHHLDESGLQKALRRAATEAGITKHVTPHIFRHCFATHLLEAGYAGALWARTVQELLGHKECQNDTDLYSCLEQRPV
jgi:integron integrase